MNILFWVLQGLLAAHTLIGAIWKFSHTPAQTMPSLASIPQGLWVSMSVFEVLCALALVLPALNKSLAIMTPVGALCLAAEMLIFCGLHLRSGGPSYGPMIYWLVVAALCVLIAYGRLVLKPL